MLNKMKIFSKINRPVILGSVVIFALFFLGLTQVYAESACSNQLPGLNRYKSCQVNAGDELIVNAEGCTYTCYKIVNSTPNNLFIPTNTCFEWDTFLAHLPAEVTTSTCVTTITPTISFSDITKTYGDPPFTIPHSTNSDGEKSFTSSNEDVATIDNTGWVTIVGVGATIITFSTAETAAYSAGTATATLTVNPITSTCTVTATNKTYGDANFTIGHNTTSDGTKTFSSSKTSVATIDNTGWVTIKGVGTTTITMNVDATPSHGATSCSATLTIAKATPTCSVTATNITIDDDDFTIGHYTSSDGAKTFNSSNTSVATINSTGFVTKVGAGTTTITMNVAATTNYNATSCSNTLVIEGVPPICNITETVKSVDAPDFIMDFYTNSTGAKTFSSSDTNVATITVAGIVSIVSIGTTTITMNVAANVNYSATSCSTTLTVTKATPTCSVTPVTMTYGGGTYMVPFETNSSGAISFSSDNATVATIDPSTGYITIGNAGTANITMNVDATDYHNAISCTGTQTVNRAPQPTPLAPTCDTRTTYSITLSPCEGCEYRIETGDPQASPTFNELYPVTSYTFSRRVAETDNKIASPWSPTVSCWTRCASVPINALIQGAFYPIVEVGTQCWMAKNLNYASGGSCYNNDAANCEIYGRLYDPYTAFGICPSGWHIATSAEQHILSDAVGNNKSTLTTVGWFNGFYSGRLCGAFEGLDTSAWWIYDPPYYGKMPYWGWVAQANSDSTSYSSCGNTYYGPRLYAAVRCLQN